MIHTTACEVLGIMQPVVLAGMGGGTDAELVAAVSEAGGLGILACTWHSVDEVQADIQRIRSLTDRPFGVNFVLPQMKEATFHACLDERVPVFSFFRGDPAEVVARAHDAGAVTIYQVTTIAEAEHACDVGVDVLVAGGYEAGGHMGPMPLWSFLPEVVRVAGSRPVLAAGGIVDGQGLAAALSFGAAGVLMGTRFLATPEAPITEIHKQAILDAQLGDTIASGIVDILSGLTKEWEGVQARTLRNQLTERWAGREDELWSAVEAVRAEVAEARAVNNTAIMLLLAGEGAARIDELKPAGQIVREVIAEAEQIIRTLHRQID